MIGGSAVGLPFSKTEQALYRLLRFAFQVPESGENPGFQPACGKKHNNLVIVIWDFLRPFQKI